MDSKLSTIVFAALIFLAGAFFISKGLLHRPPQVDAPAINVGTPGAVGLSQEVRDYISAHCNGQKSDDSVLAAKIAELEAKITDLRQQAAVSKELEAKIDNFRVEAAKFIATRKDRIKQERMSEFHEIQSAVLAECKPNERRKDSNASPSPLPPSPLDSPEDLDSK